jgi:hypothetical protein
MRIKSRAALVALAAGLTLLGQAELTPAQARSVFAQCASQVGATYMGEGRWRFVGGPGNAHRQNFYNCIDSHTQGQRSSSQSAVSQKSAGAKRRAAQPKSAQPRSAQSKSAESKSKSQLEEVYEKEMFSGNESRIAAMNYVNADCSGGPLPEVRVVTAPEGGDVRMEPIKHTLNRDKKNHRAHCNGKTVDAVGIFYKSKNGFAGADKVILDVDFKEGAIKRYIFAINIR